MPQWCVPRMLFSCAGCDAARVNLRHWNQRWRDLLQLRSLACLPTMWQTYPDSRGTHHCPGYGVCHSAAVGGHRERPDGIGLRVQPTGHASAPPPPPPRCGALTVCTEWLWSSLRWRQEEVPCPLGTGQWDHYPLLWNKPGEGHNKSPAGTKTADVHHWTQAMPGALC